MKRYRLIPKTPYDGYWVNVEIVNDIDDIFYTSGRVFSFKTLIEANNYILIEKLSE